jgi:uncharacterized DUF497 family protein
MNLDFEWDKTKAEENYAKHGVSFEMAKRVFQDPFAAEFLDDREDYGEERFVILGMVEGQVLYVAYTERNEVFRIISARRATQHEQEIYLEESS